MQQHNRVKPLLTPSFPPSLPSLGQSTSMCQPKSAGLYWMQRIVASALHLGGLNPRRPTEAAAALTWVRGEAYPPQGRAAAASMSCSGCSTGTPAYSSTSEDCAISQYDVYGSIIT